MGSPESVRPMVEGLARAFSRRCPNEYDDLVQEGWLGVLHAQRKFDKSRAVPFECYARYWVLRYMKLWMQRLARRHSLDNTVEADTAGRPSHADQVMLNDVVDRFTGREHEILERRVMSDKPATLAELADEWGVSKMRVKYLQEDALEKLRKMVRDNE